MIQLIKDFLITKSETLAVAESLTAWNLQAMIWSISWASHFFQGGVTVYQEASKVALLWVDQVHAHHVNCVSQRVANEMAVGVCTLFKSSRWLSTTWYAEARGDITTPFAYYAIAYDDRKGKRVIAWWKIEWTTTMGRVQMQEYICETVLNEYVTILESL
jgi:PncC family amidohydrolase